MTGENKYENIKLNFFVKKKIIKEKIKQKGFLTYNKINNISTSHVVCHNNI